MQALVDGAAPEGYGAALSSAAMCHLWRYFDGWNPAAPGPKVRRLAAGERWIRTSGTAAQKPWISAAFRALPGIGGALKRYHLMVQPFFFRASDHSIEPGWGTV